MRKKISVETKRFFDKIYKEFNDNGKKLIKSDYFRQRSKLNVFVSEINYYLRSEKEYLRCRDIMSDKKIEFIQLDINDVGAKLKLNNKFDIINLSNVLNYLTENINEDDIVDVLSTVIKGVLQKLDEKGCLFYYSYSPNFYKNNGKNIPPASRFDNINNIVDKIGVRVDFKRFKGITFFDRINILKLKKY